MISYGYLHDFADPLWNLRILGIYRFSCFLVIFPVGNPLKKGNVSGIVFYLGISTIKNMGYVWDSLRTIGPLETGGLNRKIRGISRWSWFMVHGNRMVWSPPWEWSVKLENYHQKHQKEMSAMVIGMFVCLLASLLACLLACCWYRQYRCIVYCTYVHIYI